MAVDGTTLADGLGLVAVRPLVDGPVDATFRLAPGEAPFPMTTQPAAIEAHKLPARVRDAYRTHNVALAPRIVVFNQGASASLEHYWIATAIGAMIALACLVAAAITALRLRRQG